MSSLQRASLFTLGVLFSFVFFIVILIGLYLHALSIYVAIPLTVAINFILWIFGPPLTDLMNRWFYKVKFYSKDEFMSQFPEIGGFVSQVSAQYKFKFPKIGYIDDANPTAFTYGSTRNNARIIFTRGIVQYLSPQEVKCVFAHELGHIYHNDFVIMAVASTLIQILYELYATLARSRKGSSDRKGGGPFVVVGLISYALYFVGTYLLLFLSRTREYYADAFAAYVTKSPRDMIQSLVKIAYGIVQAADTDSSKRLLEATRAMGVVDVKNAGFIGSLVFVSADPNMVAEVLSYDLVSPWAKILELSSTHPLTGKRILALERLIEKFGQEKLLDFPAAVQKLQINKNRLYRNFYLELLIYALPYILPVFGLIIGWMGGALVGFALGNLIRLLYRLGDSNTVATTIYDQMKNPYASPMRGGAVLLDGKVVGRGVPGFMFSEDMMFQDKTGIIYLDYQSAFGFLGDIFFAIKKVAKLMGQPMKVEGWFFRGITQSITLKTVHTAEGDIRSHPQLWAWVMNVGILLFGLLLSLH